MRILLLIIFSAFALACCKNNEAEKPPTKTADMLIRAADLSYLPAIEQKNVSFYNAKGEKQDMLSILLANGCNTVRVRLWNNPADGHSGLDEVAAFANRIRAKGMKVWLDIHFSDTWADPAHQAIPKAWEHLSLAALTDSVYAYTKRVMQAIQPDIVQVGNEINNGFLGDMGSLSNANNAPNFTALLKSGIKAARETSPLAKVMVHFAGIEGAEWFFDTLLKQNSVSYDYVGLSYYPFYHGKDISQLKSALANLAVKTGKQVVIAETSYPFTLEWNDMTNNVVGQQEQLATGYPATPEGQKEYLLKVRDAIESIPNGAGFCYWGGEWIAYKGSQAKDGSSWENQALFDFGNRALPVLNAFNQKK